MLSPTAAAGTRWVPDYPHDWAIVDVETSGFRAATHRVLSLAVLTVAADGAVQGEYSTLLDPGCDPGPVHVHGLTPERLRGAPRFDQVAERVEALLRGRVLVAHNAQFDYSFLAQEFLRAGRLLPVAQRLCTLALNRRLAPPTADLKLGTLAAHYGIRHAKAHDALEDTRALAGVLGASLAAASGLGLSLPLVPCPPRANGSYGPRIPKMRCSFRSPGPFAPGGPLVQGMKIAITGATGIPREELAVRAASAGLNVMTTVSRHTSVLVANDAASGSAKARRALAEGIPVLDERTFLALLEDVRPGTPHDQPAPPPPASPPTPTAAPPAAPRRRSTGPLAGRRVLVLGGTHPDASAARARVVELGGAAAVNLSASVTDVLVLAGGEEDRRMPRIRKLLIPLHRTDWLEAGAPTDNTNASTDGTPYVLARGAVIDLPSTGTARWTVSASWAQRTACEVDVVAFALDEDGQVSCDEDFVFYGAPDSPDGAVHLSTDGPSEQSVTVDLSALPAAVRKVTVAAAVDGTARFGDLGGVEITAAPDGAGSPLAQAALDAATTERTLLLCEIYRRGPVWRLRAVGQGYDHGLAGLARSYGVDIED